jgi:hypothetical protein
MLFEVMKDWENIEGEMSLITLTVPHHASEKLETVTDRLQGCWRGLSKANKWGALRELTGADGHYKSLEVTHGSLNGWHPHFHVVVFFKPGTDVQSKELLHSYLRLKWAKEVKKRGLVSNERSVDIQSPLNSVHSTSVYMTKGFAVLLKSVYHSIALGDKGAKAKYEELVTALKGLHVSQSTLKKVLATLAQTPQPLPGTNTPQLPYLALPRLWRQLRRQHDQSPHPNLGRQRETLNAFKTQYVFSKRPAFDPSAFLRWWISHQHRPP